MASKDERWESAVELVGITSSMLKAAIKAAHHSEANHTPSLMQAIDYTRSAFLESQENERNAFKRMSEPDGDEDQQQLAAVEFKNEQEVAVLVYDEVNKVVHVVAPGQTCMVVDLAKSSWKVAGDGNDVEPAAPEPAEASA